MSVQEVLVESYIQDWENDKEKLFGFIMSLFWKAEIKPDDTLSWLAKDGKIVIQSGESWRRKFAIKKEMSEEEFKKDEESYELGC